MVLFLNEFMDRFKIKNKFRDSFMIYLKNSYKDDPDEYFSILPEINYILNNNFEFFEMCVSFNIRSWSNDNLIDISVEGIIYNKNSTKPLLKYIVKYGLNGEEIDDYIIFY